MNNQFSQVNESIPQTKKILVFGDSLIQTLHFEDSFEFLYHVESYPGILACDSQEQLRISLNEEAYDIVVLCLGSNDLGHGKLPQEVVDSLLKLHLLINTKIIAMHLHSKFELFNSLYGNQSADKVEFCAFFYEFHLSEQGCQHLGEYLQDFIENE